MFGSPHNGIFFGRSSFYHSLIRSLQRVLQSLAIGLRGEETHRILARSVTSSLNWWLIKRLLHAVKEIKDAKYFSFIVDSTPDVSNVDQLTFTVRYVTETAEIAEHFSQICGHSRTYRAESVWGCPISTFETMYIDRQLSRTVLWQREYVSGKYGLQARIKNVYPLAVFVPRKAQWPTH